MNDRSDARLALAHSLPAVAEENAVALDPLLSLGGLERDAFGDRDRVVRRSQIVAMMNGLARKSGDATIGFKMARTTDPAALGPFGRSMLVGRTLGESLALQRFHMPWLQSGTSISMETLAETRPRGPCFSAQWTHHMEGCDPTEARILTEGIAAFFVQFLRAATGDDSAALHITLPHKPASPVSVYDDTFRCAVMFGAGTDLVIRFDRELLGRRNALRSAGAGTPSAAPEPLVPACFEEPNEQLLASLLRMIDVAALWGRLTLGDAARTLGLSPRSLQRRLARLGTAYEQIVDDWRRRQAEALLADPAIGMSDVALRLGYSHPSHFIRAFRRWHGMMPSDFRRNLA